MANSQYVGVVKLFKRYWNAYGGFKAILSSPYAHVSLVVTVLSFWIWIDVGWVDLPISVLPNVIGFSLGGYAIWLALGDDKFKAVISEGSEENESPFIIVNATFVHFIVLQIVALIFALLIKAQPISNTLAFLQAIDIEFRNWVYDLLEVTCLIGNFAGYFIFIYAIFSALAATMAIFRIAGWLEVHHRK